MVNKDDNLLEIIKAIIPSLNGYGPECYGPNNMEKPRYLILLYVAGRIQPFKTFGLQLDDNNIYFHARSLEKVAKDPKFTTGAFKYERSRAMEKHYLHYEREGLIIHTKRDHIVYVTLTKKGEESCESIIESLLPIPEQAGWVAYLAGKQTSNPERNLEECHSYGLDRLRTDYFALHKNMEADFENWKKGFDLPSIKAKKELRREGLIADIKNKLENQGRLLIVGQSGTSKTTVLMELMCDYFDAGYEVLYNYGTTDIRNVDGLVTFVEDILRMDKKILVAIDNVHREEKYPIFYFIDKLSYLLSGRKLKIIMTARTPEFDWLLNGLNVEEGMRRSIRKLYAEPNFIYQVPYFTKEEVKELVEQYCGTVGDEKLVGEITEEIYGYTKGDPVKVKFSILDRRLEQYVAEMSGRYVRSPLERKTMLISSILDVSDTEITDNLLEKCGVLETAHNLDGLVLYRNSYGLWKTKSRRWALKLFSFFFNNKSGAQLEQSKQDLKDSIVALYHMREERIIYSVIETLYFIQAHNFVSIDMVESVFQQTKSEISKRYTKD